MKKLLLKFSTLAVLLLAAMTVGRAQDVPITLNQGWNWISYPHSEPMTISEALSGFTPATGDMIVSQTDGSVQYLNGRWRGNLTTLIPGKGYMYKSLDGTVKSFIFGGVGNDPSALPEEALSGEFKVNSNGTKVRFSPGNLQCRVDPTQEAQAIVDTGTETTGYMPYHTFYRYSISQMIYQTSDLHDAGLAAGPITGIAFESYSDNHYLRDNIEIWMSTIVGIEASSTSVSTSGMQKVFEGSVRQQTGWTEIPFASAFEWDGASNVIVTVVMNHGSYTSTTYWQCSTISYTCCSYKYNDYTAYDPSANTFTMTPTNKRPNTRFKGKGGVTWRFAEKQWDMIGAGNINMSSSYTGWFDLFGWGTSGHPHGATCYQPWSWNPYSSSDYCVYGNYEYNLYDQTGEADWGCNAISNGGDQPKQWRTLTKEEWEYLLNTRTGKRYAKAKVNGVNGLILLPDNWQTSYYSLSNTNSTTAAYTSNTITAAQWQTLEDHGAVFLPAGGERWFNTIDDVGSKGIYWSSTKYEYASYDARCIYFTDSELSWEGVGGRCLGRSVRLVCQSNPRIRTLGVSGVTSTTATASAEADFTGTVGARGVCWNTTGVPTYDDSHVSAGTGKGSYTAQLTGLQPNTTYHVRAYAKISNVYHYGNELTFTTREQLAVSTASVSNIMATFALCGGTVSDCDQNVTARGVCWGTSGNPTVSGSHTTDGTGTGSFCSMMENLTANTTYYVRAYATTAEGTIYGSELSFTTKSGTLAVSTAAVTDIAATTATCGGTVNNNGGSTITARGVCWGTSSSPTLSSSHTTDGSGNGSFTSQLTGLTPGNTYYVRAYATTADGTVYGSQRSFMTLPESPVGSINGLFSVSATQQVYFSQGNLQYQASTNTWRFATNQYDYIGSANTNISSSYSGWIDLFGWGTSGYNHGAVCYQPWSTSQTTSSYYAYGGSTYNLNDQSGKADWGYNAISNGGNQTNQWRTLTNDEWGYVFETRSTASGIRYAMATVNNVKGMILLPDDWSSSYYTLNQTNTDASFDSNTISASQWSTLEQHGAIFLPTAGMRGGTSVSNIGNYGRYWSATCSSSMAHFVYFYDDGYDVGILFSQYANLRYIGQSVRLVRNAE